MSNNKNCLIVIIFLSLTLLGLIYIWKLNSVSPAEIKLKDFPSHLGEWKGEDIPISQRTYAILETKDALMREYTNSRGERVVLVIVYSAINRGAFHPPEICYLGTGRQLLDRGLEKIDAAKGTKSSSALQANKLVMEDTAGKEIAWYWFTAGNRVTSNYYSQQLFFVWDELRRNRQGGALVRVSTRTIDDLQGADSQGKDFIRQIVPILSDYISPKKS